MLAEFSHPGHVQPALQLLQSNKIIILPTDSVYAFACKLSNKDGIEKMAQLKGIRSDKARFSIMCFNLANLATFSKPISTPYYRLLKQYTPGPFTFILEASQLIPKIFLSRRSAIGLRVPEHELLQILIQELGEPLVVASVPSELNAAPIFEEWESKVEAVFIQDFIPPGPSTVIDLTKK
ncbi:MAG: L-threonylcarbamoyladenylate synthase, partial [Bacteroidota bacterium]